MRADFKGTRRSHIFIYSLTYFCFSFPEQFAKPKCRPSCQVFRGQRKNKWAGSGRATCDVYSPASLAQQRVYTHANVRGAFCLLMDALVTMATVINCARSRARRATEQSGTAARGPDWHVPKRTRKRGLLERPSRSPNWQQISVPVCGPPQALRSFPGDITATG